MLLAVTLATLLALTAGRDSSEFTMVPGTNIPIYAISHTDVTAAGQSIAPDCFVYTANETCNPLLCIWTYLPNVNSCVNKYDTCPAEDIAIDVACK